MEEERILKNSGNIQQHSIKEQEMEKTGTIGMLWS